MKQERLNEQLVLRVPTPLRESPERIAAERDRSLAYLLREALQDWTERQRSGWRHDCEPCCSARPA